MMNFELGECVVVGGEALTPYRCRGFRCEEGLITEILAPEPLRGPAGALPVVLPGLVNAHTHVGDGFVADGAANLTLEQGFFRPDGFKYRQLAAVAADYQLAAMLDTHQTMANSGTVLHIDFREQGLEGTRLLRHASLKSGVDSWILGQIDRLPFTAAQLTANREPLPAEAGQAFSDILSEADGISESTINDLTDPAWRQLIGLTEAKKHWRAIHCLENAGYRDESVRISGRGDLPRALEVYQPHIVVHLTVATAEEIECLRGSGAVAVINPRANAALGLPLPPVRALMESGIPILLGTDNGLLNSPNMLAELDFTYRMAKSQYGNAVDPDPARILAMATSNIRHLHNTRYHGYLAEEMPATFTVVDASAPHLRYSQNLLAGLLCRTTPADIIATFRQGRPLYRRPLAPRD